jgi:polyhydroxybutyrate depolymerase
MSKKSGPVRYWQGLLLAALFIFVANSFAPAVAAEMQIDVAGQQRSYILDHVGTTPKPLIIALHGGGGSAQRFRKRSGLKEAALSAGFSIVFLDSESGNWNDGRLKPDGEIFNAEDDTAFVLALVGQLVQAGVADRQRIYITGHSNGGMMSFAMGCRYPKVFSAMAAVSANMPRPMDCATDGAIAVLNIVGLRDRVVPFEGGGIFGRDKRGKLMSVEETWTTLLKRNNCAGSTQKEARSAILLVGRTCAQDTRQLRLRRQGHSWPEDEVGAIIRFFASTR